MTTKSKSPPSATDARRNRADRFPSANERKEAAASHESASSRATRQARRGEPLTVENPRDRSPKQENL